MLKTLVLASLTHATPPTLEQIWARAESAPTCPKGDDFDRYPPERAMKQLEAAPSLTEEEVALLIKASTENFEGTYLQELAVNQADCAQGRLQLYKAVRRGPKSLAPRMRAILERPKAPILLALAIDALTLQENLRLKFFDGPKELLAEVTKFRAELKEEISELNAGFEKFEHEDFLVWEPSPLATAKLKALPEVGRFRELVEREHAIVAARTKQLRAFLARVK